MTLTASKLRHSSDYTLGISIPARGESSDLLNAEGDKNDYDWLVFCSSYELVLLYPLFIHFLYFLAIFLASLGNEWKDNNEMLLRI